VAFIILLLSYTNISFLSAVANVLSDSSCQIPRDHERSDWPDLTNSAASYKL